MLVPIKQNQKDGFRSSTVVALKMTSLIFRVNSMRGFCLKTQQEQLYRFGNIHFNSIYARGQTQTPSDHNAITLHDIFTGHIFQPVIFLNQPKEPMYA